MDSRRDFAFLLTALAAGAKAADQTLPSQTFRFEDLQKKGKGRAVMNGQTHTGFPLELHHTELAPGEAPHPPHHHVHEELLMVREGTVEVTINGKVTKLGPGGVGYVASNEEHGWKNVGTTVAHYTVIALGPKA